MRKLLSALVLMATGFSACDAPQSEGGPYGNNFDGANPLAGWFFYDPSQQDQQPSPDVRTLWAVDGYPTSVPGKASYSGTNSLNYNNNTDYNAGRNSGAAVTPFRDISEFSDPVVAFRCNYQTDTPGTATDQRFLGVGYIKPDGTKVLLMQEQLSTVPGNPTIGPCMNAGTWHQHVARLNRAWGQIHVIFGFDTVSDTNNQHAGWFVDNLQICERGDVDTSGQTSAPPVDGPVQTYTIYETAFNSADGWAIENGSATGANGQVTGWAVDNTPNSNSWSPASSPANSLNYNNGAYYDTGATRNTGRATSPQVNILGNQNTRLKFKCNYQTQTPGTDRDRRTLRILSNGNEVLAGQVASQGGRGEFGSCQGMGQWHLHDISLNPNWGNVQVQFVFDTVDGDNNAFYGWFVDDFVIQGDRPGSGATTSVAGASESKSSKKKKGCCASAGEPRMGSGFLVVVMLLGAVALGRYRFV